MGINKFTKGALILIPSAFLTVGSNPLVGLTVGFVLLVLAYVSE